MCSPQCNKVKKTIKEKILAASHMIFEGVGQSCDGMKTTYLTFFGSL